MSILATSKYLLDRYGQKWFKPCEITLRTMEYLQKHNNDHEFLVDRDAVYDLIVTLENNIVAPDCSGGLELDVKNLIHYICSKAQVSYKEIFEWWENLDQ